MFNLLCSTLLIALSYASLRVIASLSDSSISSCKVSTLFCAAFVPWISSFLLSSSWCFSPATHFLLIFLRTLCLSLGHFLEEHQIKLKHLLLVITHLSAHDVCCWFWMFPFLYFSSICLGLSLVTVHTGCNSIKVSCFCVGWLTRF
jgi:hypothetical protein